MNFELNNNVPVGASSAEERLLSIEIDYFADPLIEFLSRPYRDPFTYSEMK